VKNRSDLLFCLAVVNNIFLLSISPSSIICECKSDFSASIEFNILDYEIQDKKITNPVGLIVDKKTANQRYMQLTRSIKK